MGGPNWEVGSEQPGKVQIGKRGKTTKGKITSVNGVFTDFIAKLAIAEEEADECCYWLDILMELKMTSPEECKILLHEANELTAILTASSKTAKANK